MKYLCMDTLESTPDCEELHESIFLPSDDRKEYSPGLSKSILMTCEISATIGDNTQPTQKKIMYIIMVLR